MKQASLNNLDKNPAEVSIWKNKQFLLLWGSNSLSSLFFYIFTFSMPIIIYQQTNSSFAMSTLRAIEVLPNLILGMLIGVFVDRLNRKKVLIYTMLIQVIALSLIMLTINIQFQLVIIYSLGFILYTAGYMFGNAYHSVLPSIVPKSQLVSANSAISFIRNLISVIGPSLAGLITIFVSINYNLLLTIIGLLISLLIITMVKIPIMKNTNETNNRKASIRDEMKDGWNELIGNKPLWAMTIMIFITNIANGLTGAVVIFHSLDTLTVDKTLLGIIISSTGIGAIIASITANKSKNWGTRGRLLLLLTGSSFIGQLILFSSTAWYWVSIGLMVIGFSLVLINIHYLSIRQETTPQQLLGRVAGTSSMIMKLAVPISFLLGGLLAEYFPARYVFLISGLILLFYIIYGYRKKIYMLV